MLHITVQKTKGTDVSISEIIADFVNNHLGSEKKIGGWGDILIEEFEYDENDQHRFRILTGKLGDDKQPLEFKEADIIILDFPPELNKLSGTIMGLLKNHEKLPNFYIIARSFASKLIRIGNRENWYTRG